MNEQDTLDRPAEQLSWADALANFQRESVAYKQAAAKYEAACAEYERAFPDRDKEFAAYGLTRFNGPDANREGIMLRADVSIVLRDFKGRKERLTPEELGKVREEAARVADEFLAWTAQWDAASRSIEPAEKEHDAACDKLAEARNTLLATPAPDIAAMVMKLNVLASLMLESREDDAGTVQLLCNDAHRLLRDHLLASPR